MKKVFKVIAGWLGVFTLPYLVRKWTEKQEFRGGISLVNISPDKSIGYYLIPGLLPQTDNSYRELFRPTKYDFNVVISSHCDYDLDAIATAIGHHADCLGYETIRLISVGLGDQILALLDYVLRDKIHSDKVEVFVIDGIPSLDFIAEKERRLFHLLEPGVMSLRILGGWLSEIPFLSINKVWKSPAELIEQLSSLNLDYTQDDIVGCVKAVLKNGEAFYQPDNIDRLLDLTYNFNDDEDEDEPGCKIYYNYLGKPADLSDDITQKGITNVLKDLRWTF